MYFFCSSSSAVPGGSVSCSWSDSDSVFWRGAPWSQQCQEQTDHCAGKTSQITTCVSFKHLTDWATLFFFTLEIEILYTFPWHKKPHRYKYCVYVKMHLSFTSADQCGQLPATAGCCEYAALPALLQQPKPGDVWYCGQWPDGPHLSGLVQLQWHPEATLLQGQHAHHCLNCEQWHTCQELLSVTISFSCLNW